ncbi:hypothetical protein EBR96_04170 [bacterium]|nr:hypothetical protein [bacterium]
MPEVFELKSRIEGLKSIHNITYAMQIVTISRLKRIISGLTRITDASHEVTSALRYLVTENARLYNRLVPEADPNAENVLLMVFSNRGFCGSYNQDIINAALELCKKNGWDFNATRKICFGKKAYEALKRYRRDNAVFFAPERDTFNETEVEAAYQSLEKLMVGVRVHLVYFGFKSIVTQKMVTDQLFPPSPDEFPPFDKLKLGTPVYVEQSEEETFTTLASRYYFLKVLLVLRSAASSEFSQRFLLMKGAVENVKSLSEELLIELNKQRQAGITQEVSEIISTFKALKKDK